MPLNAKGRKILAEMQQQYGEKKGKEVFYASVNAGKITGVDSMLDSLTLDFDSSAKMSATIIDGGYMRAMPKIARTGIQIYKGSECGRDDVEKVRVYRPVDTVFGAEAIKSYTHLPVTLDHPGGAVDASNWKQYAVGETGEDVLREGETVRVPMILRDAAAIAAVREGKNQISVGYSCELEWRDGVSPEGEKYDAVQTNIRGNHVAIVSTARGGPELRLDKGDPVMELKTLTIDGIACQMTDTAIVLVQKLQDQLENLKKKKKGEEEESDGLKKDVAARDAALVVKDKEISDLQAKLKDALSPQRFSQGIKDRAAIIDKATKIAGKALTNVDDMTDIDIKRAVVNGKLGDVAKGWDDVKIEAAFDTISVTMPKTGDPISDAIRVFNRPGNHPSGSNDPRDQAYYDSVKELESAWKPKAAQQ